MLKFSENKENPDIRMLEKQKIIRGSRGMVFGMLKDGKEKKNDCCLVMSGGFNATHRGRTFTKLVYSLRDHDISTFRYDYFGRGMSEGLENDLKFSTSVDDLQIILDNLREVNNFSKFILLGSSYGGLVSARVAVDRQRRGELNKLILKCPITDFNKLLGRMFPADYIEWVLREKKDLIYKDNGEKRIIGYEAVKELFDGRVDRMADLFQRLQISASIVSGSADKMVDFADLQELEKVGRATGIKLIINRVDGGDHYFNNTDDFAIMTDRLLHEIIDHVD